MPADRPSVRLLLVRHGQAGGEGVFYGPEAPLTALGRRQAQHIAGALATQGVRHVVSSPFARARETAEAAASLLERPLEVDERLMEFQMGDESATTIEQIMGEQQYLRLWQPQHRLREGGETLRGFQARVSAALSDLVRRAEGEVEGGTVSIAVFTHGGTIAAAMRWAYGLTPEHDWQTDVEIHNASITEIEHWPVGRHPEGAPHNNALHRLNDVRHLPLELVTDF